MAFPLAPYWRSILVAVVLCLPALLLADPFENPKANIPPQAKPERRNAGEGMAPLPLPGTPLRRSEKKREPAAPALVGSVTFSAASLKGSGLNWQTTIIDIEQWVNFTNSSLGQRYRYVGTDFSKFSYDPTELPILYFTGWQAIPQFDDGTIAKMRQYLMDGGTWVVHSSCGRPEFNSSFREEIRRIFPDRQLMPIGKDHPIFSSFYKINQMRVRKGTDPWQALPTSAGLIETINIGTRAAVVFSPIDLSCGWDADKHPIEGGVLYNQEDALHLGSNIVTYCLAEYQYGRFFDHQKVYHQATDKTRDQLVLGQVIHNGDWDATPHGVPNLLKTIDGTTTLHVQFKRVPVDLAKDDIFQFPVLFMSGQRSFEFSPEARQRLRKYLNDGGTLIADCDIGCDEFNQSFRAEMKQLYPDHALQALASDHPLFKFINDTTTARLSPLAAQELGAEAMQPDLEVIQIDGQIRVIYSPLSMSAGWEQLPRAYNKGYADEDALKLGVNIFMYAVSH